MSKVFDISKTCIVKPIFDGSSLYEFSCGHCVFIEGKSILSLDKCPFCDKPVNSLT